MKNKELRLGQPSLSQRVGVTATTFLGSMIAAMTPVLAADNGIVSGVKGGMKEIYDVFQGILLPIAVIGLAAGLLGMLFGGQKGMEKGKQYALIIVLVIGGVYLAPLLVNTIAGWFSSDTNNINATKSIFGA